MPKHLLLIAAAFIVIAMMLASRLEHVATAEQASRADALALQSAAIETQHRYQRCVADGAAKVAEARQLAMQAMLSSTPIYLVQGAMDVIDMASRSNLEEMKVACGG